MYYKCHKINFRHGSSYIDSSEIKRNPETVLSTKPFINKYNWEEINYPSKINYSNTLENNNSTILLTYCILKKKNTSSLNFKT